MSAPDLHSPLQAWLAFRPSLSYIFSEHGIDLCQDSRKPLDEICREKLVDPQSFVAALNRATRPSQCELGADWAAAPLGELCRYLEEVHHEGVEAFAKAWNLLLECISSKGALLRESAAAELANIR